MGDSEVGNRPWLFGKETGVVVDRALRNVREKWSGVSAQRVRIILKVDSEEREEDLNEPYLLGSPSGLAMRAPGTERDAGG